MSIDFKEFRGPRREITEEEKELAEEAREVGGTTNLPREKAIRLVALRYMQNLSESDATELATIERDIYEAGDESKVAQEILDRRKELRRKLRGE